MNKLLKKKMNVYGYIALIFLIVYSIWITIFLIDSHKEIKGLYKKIEERKVINQKISERINQLLLEKIFFIEEFDMEIDSSLYKFVSANKSFNNVSYIPKNLESINSDYIFDAKWWSQLLRREANTALKEMWKAFNLEFNKVISIVSAYRSYNYQDWIKQRWCPDNLCAKAGYSEHQTGLAVDLWEASSEKQFKSNKNYLKYFEWLKQNAHKFGFTNTYQKWLKIDTYEIEPWHWRYIWEELATHLYDNKITTAELYNKK